MNQKVDSYDFRDLLLLSYFKSRYKSYDYSEAVVLLGISYEQLKEMIDKLEETGFLIRKSQWFVVSKEGELLLEKEKVSKIFEESELKCYREKWNPEKPYIPKGFHL